METTNQGPLIPPPGYSGPSLQENGIGIADHEQSHFSALVVDDEISNRELFHDALDAAGYLPTDASDAFEGLAALEKQSFDLMVLDLQMPRMDGGAVLRAVRKIPQHESMTVIISTANPHMATGEIEELADYIVLKPIDVYQFICLATRLKGCLRKSPTH